MKANPVQPTQIFPADRAHDVFGNGRPPLEVFFRPKNVAVIGATENAGSVGRTVLWNLVQNSFGGTIFPVNPKRPSVLGIKAYPRIAEVPEPVDLAVIVTPAPSVPDVVGQCVDAHVPGAVIISAGFKEHGEAGAALERDIQQRAKGRMRIIGPNCLGVMCPPSGLNATFAHGLSLPGTVGFLSQSGALCTAVLDWSLREQVGFSAFVSVGSMLDVGWGDLIDHLGNDPHTQSIIIYMETVGDARSFMSAAREVALTKPIIVIKPGRTEASAKAAVSHTGSLTGSDDVLDAAFQRCGVLRVNTIAELFYMAEVLAKQPRPRGPRLTVLTNAGGPGVLAADALVMNGGVLADVSPETKAALDGFLPGPWSKGNPVDILGDADPERYARALETAAKDPASDGLLVILTPQDMTDPTGTAEKLTPFAKGQDKPVLASWMGGEMVEKGRRLLARAGIPVFPYPDTATRVFTYMWSHSRDLRGLYETPSFAGDADVDAARAAALIASVRKSGRLLLTEQESKEVLAAYGLPVTKTIVAEDEEAAVRAADALGYPVVVKIHSTTLTHKSDVGGVRLNLADAGAVRQAFRAVRDAVAAKSEARHFQGVTVQPMVRLEGYEAILGSSQDPQFGPVLLFGSGGTLVEVYKDRALGLPPLNTTLARRMMEKTRLYAALKGTRGRRAADLPLLEKLLVRFSRLVAEQRAVREIDINPLLVSPEGILALDARVVLHEPNVPDDRLPRAAVRPYPAKYVFPLRTKTGVDVQLRPIRPEDEPLMVKFHETLSERSVYFRYMHPLKLSQRVAHERLTRICFTDYDRDLVLVADRKDPDKGTHEIMAVGRLSRGRGTAHAEFAVLVGDPFQRQGLGTEILKRLIEVGRGESLTAIGGEIHAENQEMQKVCRRLGFTLLDAPAGGAVKARLDL